MKKNLQKLLSAALVVCILISTMPIISAAAAEVPATGDELTVNGIRYQMTEVNGDHGEMEVISNGDSAYSGIIEIPDRITIEGVSCTVESVAASAFKGCTGLTGVFFPENLESIGDSAFEGCTGLTSLDLSRILEIGSAAFRGCSGLTSLSLNEGFVQVGDSAFEGCSGLTKLVLNAAPACGKSAFKGCTGMKELKILKGVKNIGECEFEGCTSLTKVIIPDDIENISDNAFKNCTALETVIFDGYNPGNFQNNIFSGCTKLGKIYVPNKSNYESVLTQNLEQLDCTVFSIESSGVFINYRVIGDGQVEVEANSYTASGITIPETVEYDKRIYSVTRVGDYAFNSCYSLISINLPSSVTAIGQGAFYCCWSLAEVTMQEGITEIEEKACYGCSKLTDVTLPESLTSIGSYAFQDCDLLAEITIPSNVTELGADSFLGCDSLTEVTFPQNSKLTVIENNVFALSALTTVTVPASVISIQRMAFYRCPKLISVDFEAGSNLDFIGSNAFSNALFTELAIPSGVSIIGKFAFSNCENLENVSIEENSCLKILGEGAFLECSALARIDFSEDSPLFSIGNEAFYRTCSLQKITLPSGVKAIGDEAFSQSGLTNVSVPSGVKWIGALAFSECENLQAIAVDSENTEYADIDGVLYNKAQTELMTYPGGKPGAEYSIPAGTEIIDSTAFLFNAQLTAVTIPSSVTAIKMGAFGACSALKTATFEGPVPPEFGEMIFAGDESLEHVFVPASALTAYRNCAESLYVDQSIITGVAGVGNQFTADGLKYEIISMNPNKVKVIADGSPCTYSGNLTIPGSVKDSDSKDYAVTEIGQEAFLNCSGLTGVSLPESITAIGAWAFEGCSKLTTLSIPDNVTQIGKYAFKGCKELTEIQLPAKLSSLGVCSFMNCTGLEGIKIPDKIEVIAQQAFDGCTGLKTVTIGSGVTAIGDMAFMGCSGLTDVTIPSEVKSIGQSAFMGAGLTEITFKGNVNSIGDCAFFFAPQLAKITFEGSVPPETIGEDLFANDTYPIRAVAPAGSGAAYEAAFSAYTDCNPVQLQFEEKQGLAAPVGLFWDGTTAKWDKVAGAAGYTVTLYKDDDAVVSKSVTQDSPAYDFKDYIMDGEGDYTFKVVANGNASVSDSPVSAASGKYQGKDGGTGIISSFSPLTSNTKTVSYGTTYDKLGLPTVLKAVVDNLSDQLVSVIKWISGVAYNGNKAGTYDFTPVLDSGYQIKDSGVKLPRIAVTVSAKEESRSNDSGTKKEQGQTPKTEVRVDPAGNTATVTAVTDSINIAGDTSQISVTVPVVTTDTTGTGAVLDTGKKAKVEINLPRDAIVQQLSSKKDVDLTLTVPSSVARNTGENTAVDIKVNSDIFAAAKANDSDVTIKIKDMDTQEIAYTWTFKGADLAKSAAPVADVNISMAVRLTTEVAQVNRVTPNNLGLVLMFDHSGALPSTASVTFSAKEKGFQPGQTLYFYFYNTVTGQIEPQGKQYTVGADGNVTVEISHCSNYVLLPNSARTITLDTRTYTMPVGASYETGVKLSGVTGAKIKAYSSTKGVASVTVLKNGNVKATGIRPGKTYIMIDVYDSKNKFLTHASVRLTVQNGIKANGNSARQYGIF